MKKLLVLAALFTSLAQASYVIQIGGGGGGSGITSLNSQTGSSQTFATGTGGTDFNISSAANIHTFNLPVASAVNTGKLSNTDWSTFNSKLSNPLTADLEAGAFKITSSSVNAFDPALRKIYDTSGNNSIDAASHFLVDASNNVALTWGTAFVVLGHPIIMSPSSSIEGWTYLEGTQIATPSNPGAGSDRLYFKSDDNLYKLTSGGVETQVNFSLPSLTSGSVIFSDGTTLAQDNARFFWDNTEKQLVLGTNLSRPDYKQYTQHIVADVGLSGGSSTEVVNNTTVNGTGYSIAHDASAGGEVAAGVTNSGFFIGAANKALRTSATDAGTLQSAIGVFGSIDQEGTLGSVVTVDAVGVASTQTVTSGTITNLYDFYAPASTLTGSTVTNRYGLYIAPDDVGVKTNYLTGNVLAGGTFASPGFRYGENGVDARVTVSSPASGRAGIEVHTDSTAGAADLGFISYKYNNNASSARFIGKKSRGSRAIPTTVVSGSSLAGLYAYGHDGSTFVNSGLFEFQVDNTVTTNQVPTKAFLSLMNSTGTLASRFNWDSTSQFYPQTDATGSNGLATNRFSEANYSEKVSAGTNIADQQALWGSSPHHYLRVTSNEAAADAVLGEGACDSPVACIAETFSRSRGSYTAPAFLQDGDRVFVTNWLTTDGTSMNESGVAALRVQATENHAAGVHGTALRWYVTPNGAAGVDLTTPDLELVGDRLGFKNHLRSRGTGTPPTATPTGNAGSGATCVLSVATDVTGTITLTTGTGATSGDQCDVTFNSVYGTAPVCSLTPADANSAGTSHYVTSTTTDLSLNNSVALTDSTAYVFNYHCIETQ